MDASEALWVRYSHNLVVSDDLDTNFPLSLGLVFGTYNITKHTFPRVARDLVPLV